MAKTVTEPIAVRAQDGTLYTGQYKRKVYETVEQAIEDLGTTMVMHSINYGVKIARKGEAHEVLLKTKGLMTVMPENL